MSPNRRIQTGAVIAAVALAVTVASPAVGVATDRTGAGPTTVTDCRVLDDPGRYTLGANVTVDGADPCVRVTADDVVLDGDGHAFDATAADGNPTAVATAAGIENLTVRDVVVVGGAGVRIEGVTDATVASVAVPNWSLTLVNATDATVADADVYGLTLRGVRNATVDGADVGWAERRGTGGVTVTDAGTRRSAAVTLSNSTVHDADSGVVVARGSSNVLVRHSRLANNTGDGVELRWSDGTRIVHNEIADNGDRGVDGADIETTVHANDIADNAGLGVAAEVTDYRNVVNATDNYWGAADGPGSPTDPEAPYTDAVTGRFADGSGDEVSAFPDESDCGGGTSNVHFDPWVDHPVADAGPQNATAA